MSRLPEDQGVREQALNPQDSILLQAPAGSGKTTLLVQRYLNLVTLSNSPDQVYAITFTNKAAQEMQERISAALSSQGIDWSVDRLHIMTIDALCYQIASSLPLISGIGSRQITSTPQPYYQQAARALISHFYQHREHKLQAFLAHVDNQLPVAESLISTLLSCRDQWLMPLLSTKEPPLEQLLHTITRSIHEALPAEHHDSLCTLMSLAQQNLDSGTIGSTSFTLDHQDINSYLLISRTLLTQRGQWRQRLTKAQGMTTTAERQQAQDLLAALAPHEHLRQLLALMAGYEHQDDDFMQTLEALLPEACAELDVLMQQHQVIDFCGITLAAYQALSNEHGLTELAHHLGLRIQHLLIDEFQDTSLSQYRLLSMIVSTWQHDAGNTVFLVGDPMQSIYGFRQADVSLFMRCKHHGFGGLPLKFLQLTTNFRSCQTVVDAINRYGPHMMGTRECLLSHAVSFLPAQAFHGDEGTVKMHFISEGSTTDEALWIIDTIKNLQSSCDSIAILARSKQHVSHLVMLCQQYSIDLCCHEIDNLTASPLIHQLISLTSGLFHRDDRECWFSILQGPWCGCSFAECATIAAQLDKNMPIIDQLHTIKLSGEDKTQRLHILQKQCHHHLNLVGRVSDAEVISALWHALSGPDSLISAQEQNLCQMFFQWISECDQDLSTLSARDLHQHLSRIPVSFGEGKVHVMSIHKAKGLEFDAVILPGLHRSNRSSGQKLLHWQTLHDGQRSQTLFAPSDPMGKTTIGSLSQLLMRISRLKERHELTRLYYVAMTRAKKHLYLTGLVSENQAPRAQSALSLFTPWITPSPVADQHSATAPSKYSHIKQLLTLPAHTPTLIEEQPTPTLSIFSDNEATVSGTLTHLSLAALPQHIHRENIIDYVLPVAHKRWRQQYSGYDWDSLKSLITTAVKNVSQHPILGELLRTGTAFPELAFTCGTEHRKHIIDLLVFDPQGHIYIIDYKVTLTRHTDIDLEHESRQHQQQLHRYRDIIQQYFKDHRVTCALFFTQLEHMIHL